MEIVVHGTKGGRQIFTPKKLGGLLDINSDASKSSAMGQEAFAIRFIENSIIFSKYKIIRDVRGDKRTGFLAFSLFLSNNKRLIGSDIISVLNKVSEEYCKRYIPENDNNLKDVREDWTFLDRILEEYKKKLVLLPADDVENMLSGTNDDAFIYYKNEEELQQYFKTPHQEDYHKFRQVLFVKSELKDKPENPLNALRHSEEDLTGKIDLYDPKYKLLFNQTGKSGVRISVKVNGIIQSSKSRINRKDELEISWSKQYCKTKVIEGKWTEISNEYIDVNDSSESVSIKEIIPPDETKTITFNIKDWKGNSLNDGKVICRNADNEKTLLNNNQVSFKGEELGKRWVVSAYNNRLLSEERPINFEKDCSGDTGSVEIILNKHVLKLNVHEENSELIQNYGISKDEFYNSELEKSHKILIESRDFNSYTFEYNPLESEINQHIFLQRKQVTDNPSELHTYDVSPGKHGTLKYGNNYSSNDKNGKDVSHFIVPNKGYKFIRFEKQSGTLVAQYEKKEPFYKTLKFIIVLIVGTIIIGISSGMYLLYYRKIEIPPQQSDNQNILAYIKGDSLILNTLISYKKALGDRSTEISESLESAINKRKAINSLNFSNIKKADYYPTQIKFISAITNIDSSKYNLVKNKLGDVSSWNLNQIADSINAVLNETKSSTEKKAEKIKDEPQKEVTQPIKTEEKTKGKPDLPPSNTTTTIDITKELQSGLVSKEDLQNWKNTGMDKFKNSIALYLQFWNLVKEGNIQFEVFVKLWKDVKNDPVLQNSEIKEFLDNICKDIKAFGTKYQNKITNVRKNANLTLRKLNEQLK